MTREERVKRYIEILKENNEVNSVINWGFLDELTDEELFDEAKITECMNKKIRNKMNNRKYVYAFINAHGTVSVVNYDATNNVLNTFLHMFDIWGSGGETKISIDKNHMEKWFECGKDFWDMLINPIFNTAFKRMGVTLTFDYPYNT